jgi:predicted Na+-dependent transporter
VPCTEDGLLIGPLPLLNFFVAVVMFSIGLRTSAGELLNVLRDRALFVRTLLANCILIPAIGFLLVRTLGGTTRTESCCQVGTAFGCGQRPTNG